MKYLFVFLLALPLLSSCEPCDCQPNEPDEPVVNCYTLRYETEGTGLYNLGYLNEYGGSTGDYFVTGSWEYEFDVCTPYFAALNITSNEMGAYSCRIYLDDVLWKEVSGEIECGISGNLP